MWGGGFVGWSMGLLSPLFVLSTWICSYYLCYGKVTFDSKEMRHDRVRTFYRMLPYNARS